MKDLQHQNYYELLDVPVNANQDEILNAYKKARAAYSGNSPALYTVFSKKEAEEILKLVDEAYSVLSNQFKRREYNKQHYPHLVPATPPTGTHPSKLVAQSKPFVAPRQPSMDLIPIEGMKNVSVKKKLEAKLPPGTTRFGKFTVNEEFEKTISSAESFPGTLIRQIRTYKNISLDQMAAATKISRPYLDAIENSDYSGLPALVFLRGFLVQISKVLELEPGKVTDTYIKIMTESKKQ